MKLDADIYVLPKMNNNMFRKTLTFNLAHHLVKTLIQSNTSTNLGCTNH